MSSSTSDYTRPSSQRVAELKENLREIRSRIAAAASGSATSKAVKLVAVSKIKPAEDIMACYDDGQFSFGENYVQELVDKAKTLPLDIMWHFIGTLQSNKCKVLAAIPNLYAVETLDSIKKADLFQRSLPETRTDPLRVFIQINTSSEEAKSGLPPILSLPAPSSEAADLATHIVKDCPALRLEGIMTIGSLEASHSQGENEDFIRLRTTGDNLQKVLKEGGLDGWGVDGHLLLSMGMSADFDAAIKQGSDSVRVGTGIFGVRPPKGG